MKAIRVEAGAAPALRWGDAPDPVCGDGEVLIEVRAASVNRADLMQVAGHHPPPPGASDILGLDAAGIVTEVGSGVSGWRPGDAVCALLGGGGYAERVAAPAGQLMPLPDGWSFEQGAAFPLVTLTCFLDIFIEAAYRPGETVLVHGGASGVGTAAIAMVREAGGRIVVTAGTPEKVERCRALGADLAINYKTEDWAAHVRDFTDGQGADIILDMVGAPYLERNLNSLRTNGRLVLISALGGRQAELDLRALMVARQRIIGSVIRARPPEEKAAIIRRFVERFWPAVQAGRLQPVIDSVYPVAEAGAAHARMASNANLGKIVLAVHPS